MCKIQEQNVLCGRVPEPPRLGQIVNLFNGIFYSARP